MALSFSAPVKFVIVGGVVTLIDLGLTYSFLLLTGRQVLAVSVGFFAGLLSSYLLHAKVSFSVTLSPLGQLPRFAVLVLVNYLSTLGIVYIATNFLDLATMIGKVISLPVVALISYFVSKHWVYSTGKS